MSPRLMLMFCVVVTKQTPIAGVRVGTYMEAIVPGMAPRQRPLLLLAVRGTGAWAPGWQLVLLSGRVQSANWKSTMFDDWFWASGRKTRVGDRSTKVSGSSPSVVMLSASLVLTAKMP